MFFAWLLFSVPYQNFHWYTDAQAALTFIHMQYELMSIYQSLLQEVLVST